MRNLASRIARIEAEHGCAGERMSEVQCLTRMRQGDDFEAYVAFCELVRERPTNGYENPRYEWIDQGCPMQGQRLALEKGRPLEPWPYISLLTDEELAAGRRLLSQSLPWSSEQWNAWNTWCAQASGVNAAV